MDHTRASVLSVCTAAIIGAGASAGGLEEGAGAGGPSDWLDCGVQAMNDDLAQDLFAVTTDEESIQYLMAEHQEKGAYLISIIRLSMADDGTEIDVSREDVGIYLEYEAPKFKDFRFQTQTFQVREFVEGPGWDETTRECDIQLCARPWCTPGSLTVTPRASIGAYVGFNGESSLILGRIGSTQATNYEGDVTMEGYELFIPDLVAAELPINTDLPRIQNWVHTRSLAANGQIKMKISEVDEIYQSLVNDSTRSFVGPDEFCDMQRERCEAQARKQFEREYEMCSKGQQAQHSRKQFVFMTCLGTTATAAAAGAEVGAFLGACAGGIGAVPGALVGGIGAASWAFVGSFMYSWTSCDDIENACEDDVTTRYGWAEDDCWSKYVDCLTINPPYDY